MNDSKKYTINCIYGYVAFPLLEKKTIEELIYEFEDMEIKFNKTVKEKYNANV